MKKFSSILAASLLALSGAAQANIVNGGFEAGLTGWTTTGDAAATGSNVFAGSGAAFMSTAVNTDLSAFSGATIPGTGGSGIQQTFTLASASTLAFRWDFITGEGVGSFFNDASYVVIDGVATLLENTFNLMGGYQAFSTNLAAGSHTISFVVTDFGDAVVNSSLNVDAVITRGSNNVPEPGSLALLGLGLVGLVAARKRR